jgi:hypothetical protein
MGNMRSSLVQGHIGASGIAFRKHNGELTPCRLLMPIIIKKLSEGEMRE